MREVFLGFARQNGEANRTLLRILETLSEEELNRSRGYYGSLLGSLRHILGAEHFFLSLFRQTLAKNGDAQRILNFLDDARQPDGLTLSELKEPFARADDALIVLLEELNNEDLKTPVKTEWYGGNPDIVPLFFMLQQLTSHGIHHRGQISQVLDDLKVENNYSALNVAFLTNC
ncbi:MAG: DinB family protein [Helicobacteraceae bacterium]|jgi:uncharacterized damage-inducible protein DinB|nr:DinB family protein [Helicobacteraceae bacterium]